MNKLSKTQKAKLPKNEEEALELLKSNIEDWLKEQLDESKSFSGSQTLNGNREAVFEQFTGKEKIHPKKHRLLLLRALKEVVAEYKE